MPDSALERFRHRLSLVAFFRYVFGVEDVHDPQSVREFYNGLRAQREGYDTEGRSYVYHALMSRARGIEEGTLLQYNANVKRHTDALNRHRAEPIRLKYFQVLAALMTEHYLDRVTREPQAFLADLNAFVEQQNRVRGGRVDFPGFGLDDVNKVAFWMATGSGKTLLMHVNYYQYLDYCGREVPENILLVTTSEGMSEQHMAEMGKSGISCQHFDATRGDLFGADPRTVKVIEIHKLVEEKSGGGKSVEVSQLEGRNLVLVDEGHKGAGSEAQAWRRRRAALAEEGFTFEYSATFGQGVSGAGTDVEEEYGRAILFDYAYPHFYEDGYGKDYWILNLRSELDSDLRNRYLLANLLAFYEQVYCYAENWRVFGDVYNVKPPLLMFIGHTVTAGKTPSSLSNPDKRSLSDVQELVLFLHRVLRNEGGWVPAAIDDILEGKAGLEREDGGDLFADAFRTLRRGGLDGAWIHADMLRRIFHTSASGDVRLVNLRSAEGEIGLRAGPVDRFFGLINIGDDANFLRLAEERMPEIAVEEEQISGSLFHTINQQESPINILLGAKKFIEGWDSWRVSCMGLMHIGTGEGPEIIQLFGRGVRLLGRERSLKRSKELEGDHPADLPRLETLNIFGIRANYMATFRDYLNKEGIDVEERETVVIPTRLNDAFKGKGLLVIRPRIDRTFEDEVRLTLELDEDCRPTIDLTVHAEALASGGYVREWPEHYEPSGAQTLPGEVLPLFDWSRLYHDVWRFRRERGYRNLALEWRALRRVVEEAHYELLCRPEMLEVQSFGDVGRLEWIALMVLRKYIERYYTREYRRWERGQLRYQVLDESDGNLIGAYEARVKRSATEFLQTLRQMLDDPTLYEEEDLRVPRVYFDRHLYLPLPEEASDQDAIVKYSPPGLNEGEWDFVRRLRDYVTTDEGQDFLKSHDRELFLLRNQSRGRGVGFLIDGERYFPDFILWLKGPGRQDIAFIDPHGLMMEGNLLQNARVQFYNGIKEYERDLNERAGRGDVVLHSHIVSWTSFGELRKQTSIASMAEFNGLHVYFPEQRNYVGLLMRSILTAPDER